MRSLTELAPGWRGALARVVPIGIVLLAWELVTRTGLVNPYVFPPVTEILLRWVTLFVDGTMFGPLLGHAVARAGRPRRGDRGRRAARPPDGPRALGRVVLRAAVLVRLSAAEDRADPALRALVRPVQPVEGDADLHRLPVPDRALHLPRRARPEPDPPVVGAGARHGPRAHALAGGAAAVARLDLRRRAGRGGGRGAGGGGHRDGFGRRRSRLR